MSSDSPLSALSSLGRYHPGAGRASGRMGDGPARDAIAGAVAGILYLPGLKPWLVHPGGADSRTFNSMLPSVAAAASGRSQQEKAMLLEDLSALFGSASRVETLGTLIGRHEALDDMADAVRSVPGYMYE
ncbi:hypothetical protein [Paraburkholderia aspalathi]|uniref:hypothetical protein n=1 Tax=Paraburkholderia aspalathi TaxID=1324617 RepID=UPI0038BC02D9